MELIVSIVALLISIGSTALSVYFWRMSFRPVVSAVVKTNSGGSNAITYNLVVRNSGTLPARNVRISADKYGLEKALHASASAEDRTTWLECFDKQTVITTLHNNDCVSCSFGFTTRSEAQFWIYNTEFEITISYEGWFGRGYSDRQFLRIRDSDSFTTGMWARP